MKPACATFSDSRHAIQTTKISFPTQSTTESKLDHQIFAF